MLRVIRESSGVLRIDPTSRGGGRGGYLHPAASCYRLFAGRKGRVRSFRSVVDRATRMALVESLLTEDISPLVAAMRLEQSVAAHESVPFAIYAFLRHPRSFEECLFCAALHSVDRDTVGAMACAVSGAYLGVEAIPPVWLAKIENRQYIKDLALKLCALHRDRKTGDNPPR